MKRIKYLVPLLLVVAIIVAAILITENPFSTGEASDSASGVPVVIDSPSGLGQAEEAPLTSDEGLAEVLAIPDTPTPEPEVADGPAAEELVGIKAWINSQPLKIKDLRGKVVLVDFWTYTCVNCIRTFPFVKLWHAKYADDGLVILGVHTPEFAFEKKLENVRQAVGDNGIGWAVALDNDYATWRAYENQYWPAKYLIDQDGIIRYTHFGEGAYTETELKIRELLEESGADLSELNPDMPDSQPLDPGFLRDRSAQPTRELYAGWERGFRDAAFGAGGYVADSRYYGARDTLVTYDDSGDQFSDLIYLQGPWYNGPESLKHGRETTGFDDYISLKYSAKSVNAVIKPEGDGSEPFKVLVTLDGEYLTNSNKGKDVVIEGDGRSFLNVDGPRLYSVIQAPSYGTYKLKLSSNSAQFGLFAFTFGVYESGV